MSIPRYQRTLRLVEALGRVVTKRSKR